MARGALTCWTKIPAPGNRVKGKLRVTKAHTEGHKVLVSLRVWPVGHPDAIDAQAKIDDDKSVQLVSGQEIECEFDLTLENDGVRITTVHIGSLKVVLVQHPAAAEAP